jgi:Domain of unknown function (DUF4153)
VEKPQLCGGNGYYGGRLRKKSCNGQSSAVIQSYIGAMKGRVVMGLMERFLPDATQVLRRFPVAVLAAVMLCAYLLYHLGPLFFEGSVFQTTLTAAFFAGGAGHLFAEGCKVSHVVNVAIAAACGFFAASLFHFGGWFHAAPLFFFGGIVLALMIAPFLHPDVKQGTVWLFNVRLALAFGLAIVIGTVFGLGFSAVVEGLNFLFNAGFGRQAHERIWTVATLSVGPLYGLSLVPKDIEEEINLAAHQGSLLERGVSMLVNYVMVPLALVYALILHAYAAKIAFLQSLPKGEIGLIVSLFAVGGTVTWLIGWPWREKGTVLLRWFMRGWFWLLPVPAVLLAIAIWRRVTDYGVTPDRYGIALVAVWTAFVFAYLVWRRNRADMRMILGAAAVLLLGGSFGPQGAFSTTSLSQVARLQMVLEESGVLKDGKVVSPLPTLKLEAQTEARSIVTTITSVNGLERIAHWYDKPPVLAVTADKNWWSVANDVALSLGVGGDSVPSSASFGFEAIVPVEVAWKGKTRIAGPFSLRAGLSSTTADKAFGFEMKDHRFKITVDGQVHDVNISDIAAAAERQSAQKWDEKTQLVVDVNSHVSLMIKEVYGQTAPQPNVHSIVFWIVNHE